MKSDFNYHGDVVVFDLDDTLFRERDFVRSGFRLIAARIAAIYNVDASRLPELLNCALCRRERYFDLLEDWMAGHGLPREDVAGLVEAYRSHVSEDLSLAPETAMLLQALADRGVVLGIVTDGRSVTQRSKIQALGLDRYVDPENILISEETGKDKSRPDNFRHFVSRYPEARRFFYIADNERKDFLIPNLLGWTSVKAPYDPDNVQEDYIASDKMSQPAFILSSLSDFLTEFLPSGGR